MLYIFQLLSVIEIKQIVHVLIRNYNLNHYTELRRRMSSLKEPPGTDGNHYFHCSRYLR